MPVILFNHYFAARVADGTKRQTIRRPRKRPIRVGQVLSLREWEGAPYRSKQVHLRYGVCTAVEPVLIDTFWHPAWPLRIEVGGVRLAPCGVRRFAEADGFDSPEDMEQWWFDVHGLPFEGELIQWYPSPV